MTNLESNNMTKLLKYVLFACVFIIYAVYFNSYRAELLDNAWMMHNIYLYDLHPVSASDTSFGYSRSGMFGNLFNYIYSQWFDLFGWDRNYGFLLSILLTLSAMVLFYHGMVTLSYGKTISLIFVLLLVVFDPYVGMAHKLRPEAFILFLMALSFFLLIKGQAVFSGFVAFLAIETHPAGAFVFAYSASVFIFWYLHNENGVIKRSLFYILGLSLAGVLYIVNNYDVILNLSDHINLISKEHSTSGMGLFWKRYFWAPNRQYYYRHIPEMIAIAVSLFLYFKYHGLKSVKNFEVIWCVMVVIVATILPRANYQYIVYAYVPIMLFMVLVFHRAGILNLFIILFLIVQIPQYAYLQYINHGYDHKTKVAEYQNIPVNKSIIGPETVWYAFKDKDYKTYEYYFRWTRKGSGNEPPYYYDYPDNFTLIVDPFFRKNLQDEFNKIMDNKYNKVKVKEFREHYKNRLVEVYSYSKIAPLKKEIGFNVHQQEM